MFTVTKLNDFEVKPIPLPKINPDRIKGYNIIPELYANIYMVASKKSGKTTCMFNILKECCDKHTKLIFFGSTIYNDPGYKYILRHFKKKGNPILKFTSLVEEKVDRLKEILNSLHVPDKDSDNEIEEPLKYIEVDEDDEGKKIRKPKKIAPEIIFIFDDLSRAMRIPTFNTLIKTNRHYKCKTIICSQNVKDITPDARENIDILILFKGIKNELLETIYEDFNIQLEYPIFLNLYYDITNQKHSFLYIETKEAKYRKNFKEGYKLK